MSAMKFEAAPLPAQAQSNPEAPRKKRKRAPAQGAADDCFTCLNRSIRCDRRRPYCSPCLENGQDCAGYKTQLTWGVGVASRGKLRGLSLPVAGTTKIVSDVDAPSPKSKRRIGGGTREPAASAPVPPPHLSAPTSLRNTPSSDVTFKTAASQPPPTRSLPNHNSHIPNSSMNQGILFQRQSHDVQASTNYPSLNVYTTMHDLASTSTAFAPHTVLSSSYEKNSYVQHSPYPTPSPTTHYFQRYPSQHQTPATPTSHSYNTPPEPSALSYADYHQMPHVSYSSQFEYSGQTVYAPHSSGPDLTISTMRSAPIDDGIEEIKREPSYDGGLPDAMSNISPASTVGNGFSFPLSGVSIVGKNSRMRYLIQYYAEVISPVIVAFDSPSNPLRNQILGLAAQSESLQHAISALSASNIRQRRESGALSTGKTPGARRSSYMHLSLTNEAWQDEPENVTFEDRKREESLHKQAAIRILNQQLAHPVLRKDDSVLATLLMLCLFHICDSGIARFQSQFAGVKKLLSLRGSNTHSSHGDTKWMTRIFTLFDSIAATVNDREGQIGGQFVESSAQADGEWPYETLSGLDSRLSKAISQLGRLNILSQGKSVESNTTIVSRPPRSMPYMNASHHSEVSTYDGNGWMRVVSDEALFKVKTASSSVQEQFWREWREVRHDLQSWSFDDTRFDGSNLSQPFLTPEQRFDTCNISEAFRYSCLLYTERLADPELPSTDPRIQDWVQKSLYHIKQVRADVYLLWPLFITGAECGNEDERSIIRERCLDIQKDSGFMNNSSCLTLLEKVWRGDSAADRVPGEKPGPRSTFRFRDVMMAEGNDGEWIVV